MTLLKVILLYLYSCLCLFFYCHYAFACWLLNLFSFICKAWHSAPFLIDLYLLNWYCNISIVEFVFFVSIITSFCVLPFEERFLLFFLLRYKDSYYLRKYVF